MGRREDPQGNAGEIPVSEWSETESGKCARQVLADDGIYQLSLSCMDKADMRQEGSPVHY